jgi:hypothetical protein
MDTESDTELSCQHCTNRDPSLIEHLYDFADAKGWFHRYFCSVCGKGWDILEILHKDEPRGRRAARL